MRRSRIYEGKWLSRPRSALPIVAIPSLGEAEIPRPPFRRARRVYATAMANSEHVAIARRGAGAVAEWLALHPTGILDLECATLLRGVDLAGADLRRARLAEANVRNADLVGTNFAGVNFYSADLICANLAGANLSNARLYAADLSGANLGGANLRGADLRGARLCEANFRGADVKDAKFSKARCGSTNFNDLDLSDCEGLSEVTHQGPSSVGVDTLLKSQGRIPEVFLLGCGIPPQLLAQVRSFLTSMELSQFCSCFISYSGQDSDFARRLHGRMLQDGLLVWFAPKDMRGGERFAEQIDQAIRLFDRLLLVLSPASMGSKWVRREIKRARAKEEASGRNVLFPISLVPHEEIRHWESLDTDSGEDLAEVVRAFHIPSFENWKDHDAFEKAFADLLRGLRAEDRKREG
jgi:hypothetical protein